MPKLNRASIRDRITPPPTTITFSNEVLLHIISFNADMEQETESTIPALVTLRRISQVCSNWRRMTIGSPTLWGASINFKYLAQKGNQWRNEVMQRTGKSLLDIKGDWYEDSTGLWRIEPFLRSVLNENWPRVRSVDIVFPEKWLYDASELTVWSSIFESPAPSLQVFKFWWAFKSQYFSRPNFVLFSNKSRLLRTLSARNIRLDLASISIPNIRCLVLSSQVSASDLLQGLSRMPFLHTLKMSTRGPFLLDGSTEAFLPHITLPRLTEIYLSEENGADDSMPFLGNITPAPGCVLSYTSINAGVSSAPHNAEIWRDILSKYAGYSNELENANNLEVSISSSSLKISMYLSDNRLFFFHLASPRVRFPEHITSTVLSSLMTLRLDDITKINLKIDPDQLLPKVARFVIALSSVKVLRTDGPTLDLLTAMQNTSGEVIVPALEVIDLDVAHQQVHISFVRDFLNSRIRTKAMPTEIVLKLQPPDQNLDLLDLKSIMGLTIEIESRSELWP